MAGPKPPGPILQAWYNWKMMRFPWRKRWLVGFDLQGNTFWEFRDQLHALRTRRVAKYSRKTHYGDVKVSPSWMQWLRHTRYDAPSVTEQWQDVARQERMQVLARQADERWASKESMLDSPDKGQPMQMLKSKDPDSGVTQMNIEAERVEPPRMAAQGEIRPEAHRAVGQDVERPEVDEVQTEPPTPTPAEPVEHAKPAEPTVETEGGAPVLKTRKMMKKEPKNSPWKQAQAQGNPGQDWQPKGWSPGPARKRG